MKRICRAFGVTLQITRVRHGWRIRFVKRITQTATVQTRRAA